MKSANVVISGTSMEGVFRAQLLRQMALSGLSVNELANRLNWPVKEVWGYFDRLEGVSLDTLGDLIYAMGSDNRVTGKNH